MRKYLAVEYTGTYQNMIKFFDEKKFNFETKNIGHQRLFIKADEETSDEIQFFKGTQMNNENGDKINNVVFISQEEYVNTSENGFELIQHGNEPTKIFERFIDPMVNIAKEINPFPEKKDEPVLMKATDDVRMDHDVKTKIALALADTILPSKSPMPTDDFFAYLTSPKYLSYFITASSLVIFALAVFDL